VEWSEIVDDALEQDAIRVDIRRGETDQQRLITITGVENLAYSSH
jgi:tRNA threonylcarbamoyladenosine biosynthesis protein TsaE